MPRATQDTTIFNAPCPYGTVTPVVQLSNCFRFVTQRIPWSYNPRIAETTLVWAVPISLATTLGITLVFSSSAYLDVSVQRVRLFRYHAFNMMGCPIRISADQHSCAAPRSFSQLITSFVAFESLGIPHTPFAYLSLNSCLSKSKPLVFLFILLFKLTFDSMFS